MYVYLSFINIKCTVLLFPKVTQNEQTLEVLSGVTVTWIDTALDISTNGKANEFSDGNASLLPTFVSLRNPALTN